MRSGKIPPDRTLARLLETLPKAGLQNLLLKIRDRELALAMSYLSDAERSRVYAVVSPEKAARLREELALARRLAVRHTDYLTAVGRVVAVLEGRPYTEVLRSHIRPAGRGG